MSLEIRQLWHHAPSPVTRALQLQCDHRRVYMIGSGATAERHLSRQLLQQWESTLIDVVGANPYDDDDGDVSATTTGMV